jgi:hypothetical protein
MIINRVIKITTFACISNLMMISAGASPLISDNPDEQDSSLSLDGHHLIRTDPNAAMIAHDAAVSGIVSTAPFAHVTKNLAPASHGARLESDATTDVWVLDNFAYTGTFNDPCGGEANAGIFVWDVKNPNKAAKVGFIASPSGSRANDVKAATMNSGDILVHTNEPCAGGPGGFEIFNVNDPKNPTFLAHVQVDEINPISDALFGGLTDNGVHNLWLFTQGANDYVAAQSEGALDGFQIFDITDPANPILVSGWGAEEIFDPGVGDLTDITDPSSFNRVLNAALWLLDGFGASANRFLHDFTISKDGTRAYLAHWDAGLVQLDISNPADPQLISVALDRVNGSLDGEVNSHSVWPSEDGSIVVEGEEDFSAWEGNIPPTNLTVDGTATPGDPTIPATAAATSTGDIFEASQTGNSGTADGSTVVVNAGPLAGNSYATVELSTAAGSPTFAVTGTVSGNLVWLGQACTVTAGDALLNTGSFAPGDIAVVRRGACDFVEKANAAASLMASAVIITNNQASTPWSGLRIWDYSDPTNPVLASIFDTECSASTEPGGNCDPAGTYSSHNVVVETTGNTVKAYISWYSDGVVVVDVTDPYNPVETARYHRSGADFEAENGGIQDIWGIYKVDNSPWIYASDRNGGLYVLKEYGAGSAKNGKK